MCLKNVWNLIHNTGGIISLEEVGNKTLIQIPAAGNTMAPCWVVLEELGYTVTTTYLNDNEIWVAEKEDMNLQADDPCTLLGLAKLVEIRGKNWRVSDSQIDDFVQRFYETDNQ
nr:putative integron gene cassette protein [uncultured bacterium]